MIRAILLASVLPLLGVRLPAPDRPMPAGGWDVRYMDQLVALSRVAARSTVRVEAVHPVPPPFDPDHPVVMDGAGVIVAPGRLVTTAGWLGEADALRLVRRDGSRVPARLIRADTEADLALLGFEAGGAPELVPVAGFADLPAPGVDAVTGAEAAAAEIAVPVPLLGDAPGLRLAAARVEDGVVFLSGALAHGMPAFDLRGRLVALAVQPTPDRTRCVAVPGTRVRAFLGDVPSTAP